MANVEYKTPHLHFLNADCIAACPDHFSQASVDLIVTDPPYGIAGDQLHKHYNRKEEFVVDGYVEVPAEQYQDFSNAWIGEAARILRPGGSIYIVSGYTHLYEILHALRRTPLREVNHLVWKYNFGVYTKKKYISSHYHILYYVKPGAPPVFNTLCRFGPEEKDAENGSLNYQDREDVWIINREYQPGKLKNKNQLPTELLQKIILYSSNPGDLVFDFFLGSFSTAKVAYQLDRRAAGFEISPDAFRAQVPVFEGLEKGAMLADLRVPDTTSHAKQGSRWTEEETERFDARYEALCAEGLRKRDIVKQLGEEFGRGRFAIDKKLKKLGKDYAGSHSAGTKESPVTDHIQPELF